MVSKGLDLHYIIFCFYRPVAHCCHNYKFDNAGSGNSSWEVDYGKRCSYPRNASPWDRTLNFPTANHKAGRSYWWGWSKGKRIWIEVLWLQEADEMTIGTLTTALTSVYWIVVNCFIHLFCLIPPIEQILPHISRCSLNLLCVFCCSTCILRSQPIQVQEEKQYRFPLCRFKMVKTCLSWSFGLLNFVSARCCETRISECKWGTQFEEGKDEGVQCTNQCISCSTGRLESEACWLKPPGKETW